MSVNEADRFVLNKIYVGRATLFGLVYGLVFGLIFGAFSAISIMIGGASVEIPGLIGAGAFMVFLIVVIFYTVGSLVGFAAGALLYNLISLVGVRMHFNLGRYMIVPSAGNVVVQKSKDVKPVTIGNAKASSPVSSSSNSGVIVK